MKINIFIISFLLFLVLGLLVTTKVALISCICGIIISIIGFIYEINKDKI